MTEEGPILAFDSSGPYCALALRAGDDLLWQNTWEGARGQAEQLFPLLEEALENAKLSWRDLVRLGVGTGPGNFTGIRIAVSAARGLSLSLGIPAIGVSRLEAQVHDLPRPVVSAVAAPRGGLYLQEFASDGPAVPQLIAAQDLPRTVLPPGTPCVGDGAILLAATSGAPVLRESHGLADAIARIAAKADPAAAALRPAPLYLRSADAAPASDPPPRILE